MKRYVLKKQVRLKYDEASGKFYAFCIETGDHFILNKTGYLILKYMQEGKTPDQIAAVLSKSMNMDVESVMNDINQFLELSEKNDIIAYK